MNEADRLKWKITRLNSIIRDLESENKKLKKGFGVRRCCKRTYSIRKLDKTFTKD